MKSCSTGTLTPKHLRAATRQQTALMMFLFLKVRESRCPVVEVSSSGRWELLDLWPLTKPSGMLTSVWTCMQIINMYAWRYVVAFFFLSLLQIFLSVVKKYFSGVLCIFKQLEIDLRNQKISTASNLQWEFEKFTLIRKGFLNKQFWVLSFFQSNLHKWEFVFHPFDLGWIPTRADDSLAT